MTDSSDEDAEIQQERRNLLDESYEDQKSDLENNLPATTKKTRGRFARMTFMKNRSVWFVWDPCGIVCAVMTYLLVLYGQFVMLTVIAPPFPGTWTVLRVVVFWGLGGLSVVAHVKSMITDPVSKEWRGRERSKHFAHTHTHTHTHTTHMHTTHTVCVCV